MTSTSRPRMPGFFRLFYGLLLLGNVAFALLNLALGQWAVAATNIVVAAFMWWVHRF